MRYEEICYPDGSFAWVSAVPRWHLALMDALFQQLYMLWGEWEMETQQLLQVVNPADASELNRARVRCWQLMEMLVKNFPRIDGSSSGLGFDLEPLRCDVLQIEALFFGQIEGDTVKPPKLAALNQYEPVPIPDWQIDEDATPIPSTDDPAMDLLAMLTLATSSQEAISLMQTLSAQQIDRFISALKELKRDPAEREQEALDNDYIAWKEENPEIFREAMGIKYLTASEIDALERRA